MDNNSNNSNNSNQNVEHIIVLPTDENSRKVFEFSRLMLIDLHRIDELVNASDVVSELEIVMFSRRMTSRCSELSSFEIKSTTNATTSTTTTTCETFGIIRQHGEKEQFNQIKVIIDIIGSMITCIKQYNQVAKKGSPLHELLIPKGEYWNRRKDLIESWKNLVLLICEITWKPPPRQPLVTPINLSSLNQQVVDSPTSSSSSSSSSSPSTSPVKSPPTSPNGQQQSTGRRRSSVSDRPPQNIVRIGGSSSSSSSSLSGGNGTEEVANIKPELLELFDVIYHINFSLFNLLWHLLNYQRILANKLINPTTTTTTTPSTTPTSSTTTVSTPPKGAQYISQTKSITLPSLVSKLVDLLAILSLYIGTPQFQSVINSLTSLSNSELIEHVRDSLSLLQCLPFKVKGQSYMSLISGKAAGVPKNSSKENSSSNSNKESTTTTTGSAMSGSQLSSSPPKSSSTTTTTTTQSRNFFSSIIKPSTKITKHQRHKSTSNEEKEKESTNSVGSNSSIGSNGSNSFVIKSDEEDYSNSHKHKRQPSTGTTASTTTTTTTGLTPDTQVTQDCPPNDKWKIQRKPSGNEMTSSAITSDDESGSSNISIASGGGGGGDRITRSNSTIFKETSLSPVKFEVPPIFVLDTSNNQNNNQNNNNNIVNTNNNTNNNNNVQNNNNNNNNNNPTSPTSTASTTTTSTPVLSPPTSPTTPIKESKKKVGLNIFSKHLKTVKQTDEQKQRNSFSQFWLDKSTHQDRIDKLPSDDKQRLQITSLGSYVSNLVIKDLLASPNPIQPPHSENFQSCVLFADISGFTALTERLSHHGQEGVELLTKNLNRYFESLIKIVKDFGGDIVKFAGDAVLCHWPTYGELVNRVRTACECALTLQKKLHNFPVPGGFLTLHIGIGCGDLTGLYVGGVNQKVEFLIAGEALHEAASCEKEAESGEIYISQACYDAVKPFSSCVQKKTRVNVRLDNMTFMDKNSNKKAPVDQFNIVDRRAILQLPLLMDMEESLQRFVPNAVLNQLRHGSYLAELRYITVIFVNLSYGEIPDPTKDAKKLQEIVSEIQTIVYRYEGTVRQFIVDDKGCVLIAAWGVPPLSHEDDPSRAVEAAMEIVVGLFKLKVISTVGVTTGKCFCGDVGSDERREYAVVGDIVNLSARLMSHGQGGVLVDEETSKLASRKIEFVKLSDPIKVKGKQTSVNVFKPIKRHTHESSNNSPRPGASTRSAQPVINRGIVGGLDLHQQQQTAAIKHKGIIGRHGQLRQMAHLVDCLRTEEEGDGTKIVFIEAEAGLGKSRFIHEVKYSFAMGIRIFKTTGLQMNESVPFYVWRQILGEYLREEQATNFKSLLELGPHVNLLNPILDLNFSISTNRRYSAPQRQETLQMLMLRLVQMAVPRGSIIIIDDAHHMDSASWTLTLNLCRQLENCLIIVALRPLKEGIPHGFSHLDNVEFIQLEPLQTREEVQLLLEQMLNVRNSPSYELPDEIVDEIFNRSQGNHFVIEEMVNGLKHSGYIDEKTGEFNSKHEAIEQVRVNIPRTVTSLITSRVDRLSTAQQLVLKVASVMGTPFTVDSLFKILPTSETSTRSELTNDLIILERLHFIKSKKDQNGSSGTNTPSPKQSNHHNYLRSRSSIVTSPSSLSPLSSPYYNNNNSSMSPPQPVIVQSPLNLSLDNSNQSTPPALSSPGLVPISTEVLYSFVHTRTQEVIYDLMLFSQRRELHHKIAKILEITCTPQNSLYISLVNHYHAAQDYSKTVEYATKAGQNALSDNNNKEAVKFFQLALKCMELEQQQEEEVKAMKKLNRRSSTNTFITQPTNLTTSVGSPPGGSGSTSSSSSSSSSSPTLKRIPFEMISITRKLGLALYNMGLLLSAMQQFLAVLKHLGIELPPVLAKGPTQLFDATTGAPMGPPSMGAAAPDKRHRLLKSPQRQDSLTKFVTNNLDAMEKREALLSLVVLSKIFLHDCQKQSSSWCSFLANQLAADSWSLQSEAYSIGIRVLGVNGDNTTPLKYYAAVLSRSGETNGYVYGNSHQAWGIYMSGTGQWSEAESGYQTATASAGKMGDKKLVEESGVFLGACLYLMGQSQAALSLALKSLDAARTREDVQIQMMALLVAGDARVRMGEVKAAEDTLREIEQLVQAIGMAEQTSGTYIHYLSLKAQFQSVLKNDHSQAYDSARKALSALARCDTNNFSVYESYASLSMIIIRVFQSLQNHPMSRTQTYQQQRAKMITEITEAQQHLERFTDTFPIGQPRLLLLKGLIGIVVHNNINGSENYFKESKEKAIKLGMVFEEELATYHYNSFYSESDPFPVNVTTIQPSIQLLQQQQQQQNNQTTTTTTKSVTPSSPPQIIKKV
ncbi:guanylyl cyclase [Cavenderia fasciculata]|uniref:Guanylyl cyclase n=1 Tax=Cavenderia fasciculata TaxID=261658 RepID=F4QCJ5_CACFS|nr:guanylyl cyclase [Cavenderia fasciculata]EGG14423.1 guanylyl cyclase [Cavenderia fasciculata]|eukprot:XP_004353832.1 guanylyl cyclase [Cavenderia fasciculata]